MTQDTPVQEPDPVPVPEQVPEPVPVQDAEPIAAPATEPVAESAAEPAAESAAELVAESAAEPAAEPLAEPFPGPFPEPPTYKPRRRGRTTLLIAAAAVLGVLAGGGLGYHIQQKRSPTPLPPLTGPVLAQPKGAGPAAPKLPAAQDGGLVYQGDLLKLLVPTPKGAKEETRDWVSLLEYADGYTHAGSMFSTFASESFQRSVEADWTDKQGDYYEVHLTQFRDEGYAGTPSLFQDQRNIADSSPNSGPGTDLAGVTDGRAWGSAKPYQEAGYLSDYLARGLGRVGNIYVEVYIDSLHPVKSGRIKPILEKQLERL
ncbi:MULTISPECIES: hypothetical protein [unclassified Streptomyces]|uniref:hypothetical protein n=1 Tax=unclassified Streptomyces TaxID=2593676 RepID=UPI00344C9BCA